MYEREYISSRISLDTNRPILCGLFLKRNGRKSIWVSMKYERLPNVCYKCGKLNHETSVCKENRLHMESIFGRWLRADDPTKVSHEWSVEAMVMNHLVVEFSPEMHGGEMGSPENSTKHRTCA